MSGFCKFFSIFLCIKGIISTPFLHCLHAILALLPRHSCIASTPFLQSIHFILTFRLTYVYAAVIHPKQQIFYGNFLSSLAIESILDVCYAYIGASNVEKNGSCNQCCSANALIYNLIQDDRLHDYRITASFLNFPSFNRIFMYIFVYIYTYIYI